MNQADALRTAPLTPWEFEEEIARIKHEHGGDPEVMHGALDYAMEELLRSLGYANGVDIINTLERWYA